MKKYFVLITICLACAFALGAVVSEAQVIYGIKHPKGSNTADIYEIEVDTCNLTLMASPTLTDPPTASWNGNAYDMVNDRYYFSQFDNTPKTLWMLENFSTSPNLVLAGTLTASISNGTFYNGKYYYIGHLTDDLYEVTFDANGYVDNEVKLSDITGNSKAFYFGDIAYSLTGVLYGSTTVGGTPTFFIYDGTYTDFTSTGAPEALQIAFGDDGVLYGYAISNNTFYTIDTSNGLLTFKCTSDIDFSDLANGLPPFERYGLCASQTTNVGYVQVWNDDTNLYVKYVITAAGVCLTETHLHVAESLISIPQTKKFNPIPGQFDYSMEHNCVTEYTYPIPLDSIDSYIIAAHAVVQMPSSDSGGACANGVFDYTQGTLKDGNPVLAERSLPAKALGAPDSQTEVNFYSLGFDDSSTPDVEGVLILSFPTFINGDLTVHEVTWGRSYPEEAADVYVSRDGADWDYLFTADNTGSTNNVRESTYPLGGCIQYVKLVDATNSNLHGATADAFDVDAVCASNTCQEETAWGNGPCADDPYYFEGKNWATYFTYTVQ